ncbi:nitric oxide reductase activation protein NorD [Desulfurivibrio alkaliphilus]|uniref:von Willebrand factor type A n=1 Tax=Desulfurivibrio alkaliphilus (strain DSM 19089 / UNIQEM U267 / AHT2) TaxID=589865 RepID=D6Z305_DESAT|nr:VWA domain-containing protein [Desulfurivibrio alkaliphilus]ADH85930.1 von Willebrand factor type A [Desulfurivibrio alkaliphilus AHT 2]
MSSELTATTGAGQALLDELAYWGKDEYLERLAGYPQEVREEVLRLAAAIWPVSYALGYNFLDQVDQGLGCLTLEQLAEWVKATLDVYEQEGLQAATRYLAEVENNFLCRLRGEHGLSLAAATPRLLPYLRGLAGYELALAPGPESWTDGETIFLPPEISLFKQSGANFTAYKLLASFQWGLLRFGTLEGALALRPELAAELARRYGRQSADQEPFPGDFYALFPAPGLAADLFMLLETHRVLSCLQAELPGLMRDSQPVCRRLQNRRPPPVALRGRARLLESWSRWVLTGDAGPGLRPGEKELYHRGLGLLARVGQAGQTDVAGPPAKDSGAGRQNGGVGLSMELTAELYRLLEPLPGDHGGDAVADGAGVVPLLGVLRPAAFQAVRLRRREERRQRFVEALGAFLPPEVAAGSPETSEETSKWFDQSLSAPDSQGLAMLIAGAEEDEVGRESPMEAGPPEYLVIGGREFKLPEEIQALARQIRDDLGQIPQRYLSAAVGLAGGAPIRGPGPAAGQDGQEALVGALVYDEWDYRRQGFRKNWCKLLLKELAPVQSTFVDTTLQRHRGLLLQLKRQFEMMRLQQRYLKRQRDGDEIDFDAVVDALADAKAGVSPGEKLFIRLSRDERNIAAVFLVDMSSSTEGWVSLALKESLTLMCEALEVLGDRYAIYGFSGMRRQRSEFYHVKDLDEQYNEQVRGRIAAINPREYTRMGPPIRHVTKLLAATEARVRLLITLSDGKPEDYDDYKGDYAIEDTRHALIEARAAGVHPFCITIDRQAQDYISHLYGAVSYCFIDDVKKLPLRLPGIYRTLTT